MTLRDSVQCIHEPFGDAFYFGPERLSNRYEKDERAREESGFGDSTYRTIFESINRMNNEVGLPPCDVDVSQNLPLMTAGYHFRPFFFSIAEFAGKSLSLFSSSVLFGSSKLRISLLRRC